MVESILGNLILGVISNGLYSILVATCDIPDIKKANSNQKWLKGDEEIGAILAKASATVARAFPQNATQSDLVKIFLVSPDCDSIVRQIYSNRLATQSADQTPVIQEAFILLFCRTVKSTNAQTKEIAKEIFDHLVNASTRAIQIAIQKGNLLAHEENSSRRHTILLEELANLQKRIDLLNEPSSPKPAALENFEEKYREQVAQRHGFISPPHLDAVKKLPIDDLYVTPSIVVHLSSKRTEPIQLSLESFFSRINRTVLLGNPGGGKSTLSAKLCFDLSHKYNDRLVGGRKLTPILVVLREYGAEWKVRPISILDFIESRSNSTYQIKPLKNAFELMLVSGRALVIFDGLDELLDTSYRREISDNVETFCNLYPNVPVIVTSREVGYDEAPLNKQRFETYKLTGFDDRQVNEYVKKWFCADTELTPNEQSQKANGFLRESAAVPDLRSNPLMLSLMCGIYKGEGYIPRNRPDLYEKCAVMLFERWDKGRGIDVQLPFESQISPAMKHLAFWIYSDDTLQNGATERLIIDETTRYLLQNRYEREEEARQASTEFVKFCRGRAWVFTDVGTTKEGEHLYQFTHRTFLEYFAAGNLIRKHPLPIDLLVVLKPKIEKGEWDVISQLAFQLQNRSTEGAGDKLITELLNEAKETSGRSRHNLIGFCARCLRFIVPREKTVKELARICIKSIVTDYPLKPEKNGHDFSHGELFSEISNVTQENFSAVSMVIKETLIEFIRQKPQDLSTRKAAEIVLDLPYISTVLGSTSTMSYQNFEYWKKVRFDSLNECKDEMIEISKNEIAVAVRLLLEGKISIEEFVGWHKISGFFMRTRISFYFHRMSSPPFVMLLGHVINAGRTETSLESEKIIAKNLAGLGTILENTPTAWVKVNKSEISRNDISNLWFDYKSRPQPDSPLIVDRLSAAARFSTFCMLAIQCELYKDFVRDLKTHWRTNHVTSWLGDILECREDGALNKKAISKLDMYSLTTKQREILINWVEKKLSFVHQSD